MHRFNDPITDGEHDLIISKFSELCEIVSLEDYDRPAREELLGHFLHYTSTHFQREEEVMREAGYPHLEKHLVAHAYMQDAFERLRKALSKGGPNLQTDLGILRHLFLQHILTFDEAFGEWLFGKSREPRHGRPQEAPRGPRSGRRAHRMTPRT